jgi:hypothetical protein
VFTFKANIREARVTYTGKALIECVPLNIVYLIKKLPGVSVYGDKAF